VCRNSIRFFGNEKKMEDQSKSVSCVRDLRAFPPSCYHLPTDGRKTAHLCNERQRLALLLATYADGDGSRIYPGIERLMRESGMTRRTLFNRLDDLRKLGILKTEGLTRERGTARRSLDVSKLKAGVQDSDAGVQNTPEPECKIADAGVQNRTARVQNSGAGVQRIGCTQPSPQPPQQTDQQTASLPTVRAENGGQAGSTSVSLSLSTKTRWQEFIREANENGLCDEMLYAIPKAGEYDAVLKQLEMLGGDVGNLVGAIDDWAAAQSPPLDTLHYGRWTRWLEQSVDHDCFFEAKAKTQSGLTA
jgi:hypothetical protein